MHHSGAHVPPSSGSIKEGTLVAGKYFRLCRQCGPVCQEATLGTTEMKMWLCSGKIFEFQKTCRLQNVILWTIFLQQLRKKQKTILGL